MFAWPERGVHMQAQDVPRILFDELRRKFYSVYAGEFQASIPGEWTLVRLPAFDTLIGIQVEDGQTALAVWGLDKLGLRGEDPFLCVVAGPQIMPGNWCRGKGEMIFELVCVEFPNAFTSMFGEVLGIMGYILMRGNQLTESPEFKKKAYYEVEINPNGEYYTPSEE